jgi:competence protein ComEC
MGFKRPLVWLLFSYLAGMGLCTLQVPITGVILVLFLLIFFLFIYFIYPIHFIKHKLKNCNFLFITPILLILGYMLLTKQLQPSSMYNIFESKIKGSVTGRLITIEEKEEYNLLTFKDNLVSTYSNSNSQTYHINKIIIYDSDKLNYKIGNTILVSGQIIKFQKASNPGQFDEYLYYKTNNIDYKVYADEVEILDSDYSRFFQFLFELKRKFIGIYYKILPMKNAGVLSAMILGEKALLDSEVKQLYQQNGISHILSISGLHISLLGITLYKLLRKIRISLFPSTLISVFIIVSYGILTNFSVSTNRAVVMLIIFMGADLIGRTYDIISATALSALIICIISPLQIVNAGFLLSFGAILGIGILYPIIASFFPIKNFIIDGLFVSFSIQVMTTPLLLYFFYEIPTYSMLINMIILPVSSIIVLMAILSGLIGCITLPISIFLIGSVHYILIFYELVCRIGMTLPKNSLILGRPSLTVIFTYYCVILLFIALNNKVKTKRSILLGILLFVILIKPTNVEFKVTFLDVGQGDGIFFMTPNKMSFLIDGGSTDVKSVGQYRILPFLKYNGIEIIDYVIITHTDNDHISGIKELISNQEQNSLKIKHLVLPIIKKKEDSYNELENLAYLNGVKVLYIETGDIIKAGEVVITCMHPYNDYQSDSINDTSTVLSVNYKQFDMLLTGDLEAKGEETILQIIKNSKEDYDILKVAHHGSKYSTQADFLNIMKPEYAIISCSKENSYGHPHEEVINRLEAIKSNIIITKDSGAITITTDGDNMVIEKYKK